MDCPSCGLAIQPSDGFCGHCGSILASVPTVQPQPGATEPPIQLSSATSGANGPASPPTTLPGTPIVLGHGEVLWRNYHVTQLRSRDQGEGVLFVTNTRVVFYARARGRGARIMKPFSNLTIVVREVAEQA